MGRVYVWVKGRVEKMMEQYELNYRQAQRDTREVDRRCKMDNEKL